VKKLATATAIAALLGVSAMASEGSRCASFLS
jgi:hypothetical protein